ncbi:MAG: hypothetical protein KAX49_20700, partial [Halanaerobiales bacterium]|nr:hypothetical protein [Halanaerobiales bacterium]
MKKNILKINPLTPMQSGMLYHSLLNEKGLNYYEQICFNMEGKIDLQYLKEAWQKLIDRYEILRTNFVWKKVKTPVQIVLIEKEAEIYEFDISNFTTLEKEKYIRQLKKEDLHKRFDFEKGKLNRLSLIKLADDKYFVCWTFHHILLDGWSIAIVLEDFFNIYQSMANNLPLPSGPVAHFSDYLEWLKKQNKNKGLKFWKNYLQDFTEPSLLPYDKKANENEEILKNTIKQIELSEEKTETIRKFCKKNSITMNALIQTIWGLLLQKYNNTDQSCFGMTVSGRPTELQNVEDIVGIFINTIPVVVKTEEQTTI